jgi:hypothetical protein
MKGAEDMGEIFVYLRSNEAVQAAIRSAVMWRILY